MQSNVLKNEMAVIKHLKSQPFVTLLLPFEPKMISKSILEVRLKSALEKVKNELYENYSFFSAKEVFDKLDRIISNLNYNTHKKSIAVLASSDEQKVIYLDYIVEERYFVTNSFQIRELVRNQRYEKDYILVILHEEFASIYRGQEKIISKILHKIPDFKRLEQQSENNYSHKAYKNEDLFLQDFLQSIDNSLAYLLQAFFSPVFILGSGNILDKFKRITRNNEVIVHFITCEFDECSEDELERVMEPHLSNWQFVKGRFYKQLLENAFENGKLEVGIEGVWNLIKNRNVKLLVVEDQYEYQAYLGKGLIVCAEEAAKNPLIKDVVEDAIERTLSDGGNVAFVSQGTLSNFMHIAAVRNY